MTWQLPDAQTLWRAIEIYMAMAYDAPPSLAVQQRLDGLRSAPRWFDAEQLERVPAADPTRLSLRLGNRFYPHMKLVVERSPDGVGHLFRADTHDAHIQAGANSPEYAALKELIERNQKLASQIEAAWEQQGLMTFKSFLRAKLGKSPSST